MKLARQAPRKAPRRPRIALQELEEPFPLPRPRTRLLGAPWPFPESVVRGKLVRNVYKG